MSVYKHLAEIQQKLKAPKNQFNSFGKYNYRSCEDIVDAVKPFLGGYVLLLTDEVKAVGDRVYVEATAKLVGEGGSVETKASAREAITKKGMDDSQITGSTSSYARKYALNGLFAIDDNKDADTMDNSSPQPTEADMSWVHAIRNNQTTLDEIQDPKRREYIKSLL